MPAPKTKALFTAPIYGLVWTGANDSWSDDRGTTVLDLRSQIDRPTLHCMTEEERRILAAQGYVELHLYEEAREELAPLPAAAFDRVDVIEILLLCLMAEHHWAEALAMALRLCELEPEEAGGFIHAAYCLHEMRRTEEALDLLSRGPASLRCKAVYYYNLGCYHACLGNAEKALKLLRQSFEMDGSLRIEARKDSDLDCVRSQLSLL